MKTTLFLCGILVFANSCSKHESVGNTVETENSVAILVLDPQGKPASNVDAEIRPMWYVADTANSMDTSSEIRNVRTDSIGRISCEGLPLGRYMVKAYVDSLGSVAQLDHLDTNSGNKFVKLSLSPFGGIHGSVSLPQGAHHAWIQVFGLDDHVKTDSLGRFTMNALPPGLIRIRAITFNTPSALAETEVKIQPKHMLETGRLAVASVDNEDLSTWRYSRSIPVDSLVSDWMRPLSNPTVVTLNMDSTDFNFAEAMTDGRDIRILDIEGNPLPIQRVRWDAKLKRATVRVRMETAGLDSSSAVTLLWGRFGALHPASSPIWDGISDSLKNELYTLLVDDFEDQNIQTAFPAPIPPTAWYLVQPDSDFVVNPALKADLVTAIQPAVGGRIGYAAHISYSTVSMTRWLIWGTDLGPAPRSLATLDSIEYWVRGSGLYFMAFDRLTEVGGKAWLKDSLSSDWVRKCIRPRDLIPPDSVYGNVGWDNVADSLTNLTFFALNGNDFWIDDIRMYGVNRDNLK